MSRPDWDAYFLGMAREVAGRSTCDRARVGCILVDTDRRIVGTGYNGSPSGLAHCDEVGHLLIEGHCIRTLHAEANALDQAGRAGRGATCYVTHFPCLLCAKALIQRKIARLVWIDPYRIDPMAVAFLVAAGVQLDPEPDEQDPDKVLAVKGLASLPEPKRVIIRIADEHPLDDDPTYAARQRNQLLDAEGDAP